MSLEEDNRDGVGKKLGEVRRRRRRERLRQKELRMDKVYHINFLISNVISTTHFDPIAEMLMLTSHKNLFSFDISPVIL